MELNIDHLRCLQFIIDNLKCIIDHLICMYNLILII